MMQHIFLGDLPEDGRRKISSDIMALVEGFAQEDSLNLDALDKIVIANDMKRSASWLKETQGITFDIGVQKNHFSESVAIALTDDVQGDFVHHLLLSERLFDDRDERIDNATMRHILHHELIHIHDHNLMIRAGINPGRFDQTLYELYTVMPAKQCWSEYYANRMSARSAPLASIESSLSVFANSLTGTKRMIDQAKFDYKIQSNRDQFLGTFLKYANMMVVSAAYVLGYLHSNASEVSKEIIRNTIYDLAKGTYFETSLEALDDALMAFFNIYPACLEKYTPFESLSAVIISFFNTLGVYPHADGEDMYTNIVC